jgi:ABC-2 type transport system ATP-binding protein
MLQVDGLSKAYGQRRALVDVDLEVAAGEITALLGRNGAGKTTLVSIVAGLRVADGGTVTIAGIEVSKTSRQARARLGIAPQETGVYPTLSCRDNLRLFAGLAGHGRRDIRARIDELAESLALTGLLDRRAKELSGGERRRLHTAIALVGRPELVLLDEPTVGADIQTRARLLAVVRRLAHDGAAVVYSTHYFPEVEELGATLAILERGRMLARGHIADVVAEYAVGEIVLTFAGRPPDLTLVASDQVVTTRGSHVRIETNDPASISAAVLASLDTRSADLRGLTVSPPSLEAAFLRLTDGAASSSEERAHVA